MDKARHYNSVGNCILLQDPCLTGFPMRSDTTWYVTFIAYSSAVVRHVQIVEHISVSACTAYSVVRMMCEVRVYRCVKILLVCAVALVSGDGDILFGKYKGKKKQTCLQE